MEFGGCETVLRSGPTCVLDPEHRLTLWAAPPTGSRLEVRVDSEPLAGEAQEVGEGQRLLLELPKGASRLEVRARHRETGELTASWTLALAPSRRPPWLREAPGALQKGDSRALEELRGRLAKADALARGQALGLLGEAEYRYFGHPADGLEHLRQAQAELEAAGSWQDEVRFGTLRAFLAIQAGDHEEAARALEALKPPAVSPAEAEVQLAYQRSLLATRQGLYRVALGPARQALELARHAGSRRLELQVRQHLANLERRLGHGVLAERQFGELRGELERSPSRCDLALFLNNWGWDLLLAREAGRASGDPLPLLRESDALFQQESGCPNLAAMRMNGPINLAFAQLQAGRLDEAGAELRRARGLAPKDALFRPQELWWSELAGRLALRQGRREEARRAFRAESSLACAPAQAPDLVACRRAELGQGEVQWAAGDRPGALAHFEVAERLLERQARHIPYYAARESFLAEHEAGTRRHLELLLEAGREREAFELARRHRRRVLGPLATLRARSPEERAELGRSFASKRAELGLGSDDRPDERLLALDELQRLRARRETAEQSLLAGLDSRLAELQALAEADSAAPTDLPPLAGDRLVLLYQDLGQGRWVGFGAFRGRVRAHRFSLPEDPSSLTAGELSRLLLEPFAEPLRQGARALILAGGELRSVDFHALPWGRDLLLAEHEVIYGLDLGAAPSAPGEKSEALVVGDPDASLPEAKSEAAAVAERLAQSGFAGRVRLLVGEEAREPAVLEALDGSGLFHFAGHGSFEGVGGWLSDLRLAAGGRLRLGDVLTLPEAPRLVILSACDTARSSEDGAVEGVGLANAFLLAGSQAVIAASRPVGDLPAAGLFAELYRRWQGHGDPAQAFREAQLAWRRQHPEAGSEAAWASFRLLEP